MAESDKSVNEMYSVTEKTEQDLNSVDLSSVHNVSSEYILTTASEALALRGIYLEHGKDTQLRGAILEPPKELRLNPPKFKQSFVEKRIKSHESLRSFTKQVKTMGFGIEDMVNRVLDETGHQEGSNPISFLGMYTTVPTAHCTIDCKQWKLTQDVVSHLKQLQDVIKTNDSKRVQDQCQTFLKTFGSHVICGDIHFGGIYSWQAQTQGGGSREETLAKECLDSYILTGVNPSLEVNVTSDKLGGPQEANSFNLWKLGLEVDCNRWALIQRKRAYTGIWEIVLNHTEELQNVRELADTLEKIHIKDTALKIRGMQGKKLLNYLSLNEYYPERLSINDIMNLDYVEGSEVPINENLQLSLSILQKLIMLDYRAFSGEINEWSKKKGKDKLNPLDVFLVLFVCCDLNLRQILVQKMNQCRLAFPFLFPGVTDNTLTYSLWPLRSIILEFRDKGELFETSLTNFPPDIVSFLRLGRPDFLKSKMLNHVLSDQFHEAFFNFDCPHGNINRTVADGLVEASFSLPSGKKSDAFKAPTLFLNLRGDALMYDDQVHMLSKLSDVLAVCIDIEDITTSEVMRSLQDIRACTSAFVVVLSNRTNMPTEQVRKVLENAALEENVNVVSNFEEKTVKSIADFKGELRGHLTKCLDFKGSAVPKWDIALTVANVRDFKVDETQDPCKRGIFLAETVISSIPMDGVKYVSKDRLLPLQGNLWREWTELLKTKKRRNQMVDVGKMERKMSSLRQKQMEKCKVLSDLMCTFTDSLSKSIKCGCTEYFLQSLRLRLDEISRKEMSPLRRKYREASYSYRQARMDENLREDDLEIKKEDKAESEMKLLDSTFGVEHLFREMGQIFEAVFYCNVKNCDPRIKEFPTMVAKTLLKGQALEIMDGDVCGVPEVWLRAVLTSLSSCIGTDKSKIFTLSVLGIQSSGKTTLLNTMLGLQMPVSAGRCTRGIYMKLVPTKPDSKLPFDYLLVLDTEGLRAPELGGSNFDHDNELATFVVGLGDATLLNIKGENVAEVQDILQIVVHAFLRMRMVNENIQKSRTCLFIHQNIPALNAKEQMAFGHLKFKENLDRITIEAASSENISEVKTFDDVISFDSKRNIWYFSELWQGDLPMATVNPGYHEHVQAVKHLILEHISQTSTTIFEMKDMKQSIQDIWDGVLADNFIYSFRNSDVARAYRRLDKVYSKLKWELESSIHNWLSKVASVSFKNCRDKSSIQSQIRTHTTELKRHLDEGLSVAVCKLETFIQTDQQSTIISQWQQDKICSLKASADLMQNRALYDIRQFANDQKVFLVHETGVDKHKKEISEKARTLAAEMQGYDGKSENILEKKFSDMWSTWIQAIGSQPEKIDIRAETKTMLEQHYHIHERYFEKKIGRPTNQKHAHERPIEKEVSQPTDQKQGLTTRFVNWWGKKGTARTSTEPQSTKLIWKDGVDLYLENIRKHNAGFDPEYARCVISIVAQNVQDYNKHNNDNKIPTADEVVMAKYACDYAHETFVKMQRTYDETTSVTAKLENYRKTTWNLFKNLVKQSNAEVTLAEYITDQFEEPIKSYVQEKIHQRVIDDIVPKFYTKRVLIKLILKTLADDENFTSYQMYVWTPKMYALKWLIKYTEDHINTERNGMSWYIELAKEYTHEICNRLEAAAKKATDTSPLHGSQTLGNWMAVLSKAMEEHVALPTTIEHNVEQSDVCDFDHLEELIVKRKSALEHNIISDFERRIQEGIKWSGKTPFEQILDSIWGCDAYCPFCKEPCMKADPNHAKPTDPHECVQHRPRGVGSRVWIESDKLMVESCNFSVQSECGFRCTGTPHSCDSKKEDRTDLFHPYKSYKTYLPKWDIPPSSDMRSSHYWMWYMTKYKQEIADACKSSLPDIPVSWEDITKEEAIESLHIYN